MVERGGDAAAAGIIWTHLEAWGLEPGFTPYPDDDLQAVFGIAEEELEIDLLGNLITRLSLPQPTTEMLREFGPLDTPLRVATLAKQLRDVQL